MFSAISLASGSDGNSILVSTNNTRILLDAGISIRNLTQKLKYLDMNLANIDAIFLTHDHNDHSRGSIDLSRKFQIPVWCSTQTHGALKMKHRSDLKFKLFRLNDKTAVGDLVIKNFPVMHDATCNVGFSVRNGSHKICYLVDFSSFGEYIENEITDADLVIIDSNYDRESLLNSKYPYSVKHRIINTGHLSNETVGNIILRHPRRAETEFWLAHLSENSNSPRLATITINYILQKGGCREKITYKILPRKKIGPLWKIGIPGQLDFPVL